MVTSKDHEGSGEEELSLDETVKSEKYEEYIRSIKNETPLTIVLKTHLYVESRINSLLVGALERPNVLDIDRLSFHQKIRLIDATGLVTPILPDMLHALNNVRINFSHLHEYDTTKKDIERLLGSLPAKTRREFVQECAGQKPEVLLDRILSYISGYTDASCATELHSPRLVPVRQKAKKQDGKK